MGKNQSERYFTIKTFHFTLNNVEPIYGKAYRVMVAALLAVILFIVAGRAMIKPPPETLLAQIGSAENLESEILPITNKKPPQITTKKKPDSSTSLTSSLLFTELATRTQAQDAKSADNFAPTKESPPEIIAPCDFDAPGEPTNSNIIINEVAWMGTTANHNGEWLELKNRGSISVAVGGWQILDSRGNIKIFLDEDKQIPLGGFFLLERNNDNATPARVADQIYTGVLTNSNDELKLFNEKCIMMDSVRAEGGWPAGDNVTKATMERSGDLSWHTSASPGGTPRQENSEITKTSGVVANPPPPASNPSPPTGTNNNPPQPPSPPATPAIILISEIFIDMEGSDTSEFVELYNAGTEPADLSLWSLQYLSGSAASFESVAKKNFTGTSIIPAHGFFLIGLGGYSGSVALNMTWSQSLNNSGATVFLVRNQEKIISEVDPDLADTIAYGTGSSLYPESAPAPLPPTGQSLERKAAGCASPQNAGENQGNACDTQNNATDFEIRPTPLPQNTQTPPEL